MQPITPLPCASATLRRAARAVSQIYAEEFRGTLEGPQYSLLKLLSKMPGSTQSALGKLLLLDKTTLSRNLNLLKKNGWVETVGTEDRRERGFSLTAEGEALVAVAEPCWTRAQKRLRAALGTDDWQQLFAVADNITHKVVNLAAGNSDRRGKNL